MANIILVVDVGWLVADSQIETIETIIFKDSDGIEHEEYAFRAPMKGAPENVIELFCANVKLRLYWDVFREQVKGKYRKGAHLRRLARFARAIYQDIQGVDKPFNATMLSKIDGHHDEDGEVADKTITAKTISVLKKMSSISDETPEFGLEADEKGHKGLKYKLREASDKAKYYIAEYAPKIGLGLYTRFATMWWLMMPCLFTKYYLWDPALDEFIKLKRSLVMYPEFQLVKLRDVDCKSIKLFKRILDTCKLMNPLMYIDFGQMSLDRMTRFKQDKN